MSRHRSQRIKLTSLPLDSKARAGSWAKAESRRRERAITKSIWPWLVLLSTLVALLAMPIAWSTSGVLRGLALGVGLSSGVWLSAVLVFQLAGSLGTRMGAAAECWTDEELRELGHRWRIASHLIVDERGEIDHIAIGPAGVFLLETKWSAQSWQIRGWQTAHLKGTAVRTVRRAKSVSEMFASHGFVVRVEPVVVLWSSSPSRQETKDRNVSVLGARIIRGSEVQSWFAERPERRSMDVQLAWTILEGLQTDTAPQMTDAL